MNKFKQIIFITILAIGIVAPNSAFAQTATPSPALPFGKQELKDKMREMRQEIKDKREEFKGDIKEMKTNMREERKGLMESIKSAIPFFKKPASIINGEVTAVGDTSLTVEKDGKSYTVNTNSKTKLRRRFWGGSSISEISVGNHVNVWGKWADEGQTTINAVLIRNLSIQKRNGVFFGNITTLGSNTFVMSTIGRGNQTVTVGSSTKMVDLSGGTITFADLKAGDRVRVRGVWDRSASTITDVKEIKNFGAKVSVTITLSPTSTPTPTLTPTPTP